MENRTPQKGRKQDQAKQGKKEKNKEKKINIALDYFTASSHQCLGRQEKFTVFFVNPGLHCLHQLPSTTWPHYWMLFVSIYIFTFYFTSGNSGRTHYTKENMFQWFNLSTSGDEIVHLFPVRSFKLALLFKCNKYIVSQEVYFKLFILSSLCFGLC